MSAGPYTPDMGTESLAFWVVAGLAILAVLGVVAIAITALFLQRGLARAAQEDLLAATNLPAADFRLVSEERKARAVLRANQPKTKPRVMN